MHRGKIVEHAPTNQVFAHPTHPYTQSLLAASPRLDRGTITQPMFNQRYAQADPVRAGY
jgi:oligopeptide/dipeptide ABC transporter ATP-binding protein